MWTPENRDKSLTSWIQTRTFNHLHPRLTWVQQTALKGRLERCEQLLPLIGSFQTKLQVFDGSFGFWEI